MKLDLTPTPHSARTLDEIGSQQESVLTQKSFPPTFFLKGTAFPGLHRMFLIYYVVFGTMITSTKTCSEDFVRRCKSSTSYVVLCPENISIFAYMLIIVVIIYLHI